MFKIKDGLNHGYKLELQMPEMMKLLGNKKILIDKRNGEKVPSLERAEVVLVQCNLVNNEYQQNSEVFYTFTSNDLVLIC